MFNENSIVNWINNGIDFTPGLVPYRKSECAMWRNGECINIQKVEKVRKYKKPLLIRRLREIHGNNRKVEVNVSQEKMTKF